MLSFLLLASLPLSGCTDTAAELSTPEQPLVLSQHDEDHEEAVEQTPLHLSVALEYEGVTEVAANTGPEIDLFLANLGLDAGLNYCAAFVSYALDQANPQQPNVRSGVAQHFITDASINAKQILRGTHTAPEGSVVVWKRGNTWQGHAGFTLEDWQGAEGWTIEANTSPGPLADQRNGDGIYRKQRTIQPASYFRITHFTPVYYT